MPGPIRHLLSGLLGVVVALLVMYLLPYLTGMLYRTALIMEPGPRFALYGAFLLMGALVGVLAAARFSPVGALVAGVPLVALGLLHPIVMLPQPFPGAAYPDPVSFILVGSLLIISAVFPHRWRPAHPPVPTTVPPPPWAHPHDPNGAMRTAHPNGPRNSPWPRDPNGA